MNNYVKTALLLFFSVLVALLLAEASLALVNYSSHSFHQSDSLLGSSLSANTEGVWKQEGNAVVKINSDGLRDVEHAIEKPQDVFRIAVLGDSYMEAFQVDFENSFPSLLQHKLQHKGTLAGKKIEVINFGCAGYGTARELIMLQQRVWKYKPDLVLLAFLTANDIRDNSKTLNKVDYIPYYYLDKDKVLQLDQSFLQSDAYLNRSGFAARFFYAAINNIRLLQLTNDIRLRLRSSIDTDRNDKQTEAGLDDLIYLPPNSPVWEDAWNVTEALILKMRDEVVSHNARFQVVTLSNGIQVSPNKDKKQSTLKKLGIDSFFYPDTRIREFAQKNDIKLISLAPELAEIAESEEVYFHGFENTGLGSGHWNETGHLYAAEIVARDLCIVDC